MNTLEELLDVIRYVSTGPIGLGSHYFSLLCKAEEALATEKGLVVYGKLCYFVEGDSHIIDWEDDSEVDHLTPLLAKLKEIKYGQVVLGSELFELLSQEEDVVIVYRGKLIRRGGSPRSMYVESDELTLNEGEFSK